MPNTICRMYGTEKQATRVVEELKRHGYTDVHVFAGAAPASGEDATPAPSAADIASRMMRAYLPRHEAQIYADRVAKGHSLVALHADWSTGELADRIMKEHGPIHSGVTPPAERSYAWDDCFPFSSALQLPLLTSTALPFETISNVPSISRPSAFFSSLFGWKLLTDNRAPFSRWFGWGTQTADKTPFSSKFGLPLLSQPSRR